MDIDTRVLALLAEEHSDDDGAHSFSAALPPSDVWNQDALVDAWLAACSDFRAFSLAASTASLPVLPDREQQLNASPLWYAAPFRASSSSSSPKKPIQTIIDKVQEEQEGDYDDDEQYDEDEGEHDDEAGYAEASMDVSDQVATSHDDDAHPQIHTHTIPATITNHPSTTSFKIKHSKTGPDSTLPYFDPAEWEPVTPAGAPLTSKSKSKSTPSAPLAPDTGNAAKLSTPSAMSGLNIPSPPSPEHAILQDPTLADPQVTSEQALQNALNAWYTAGYAAAIYHVRSGMVKP